MGWWGVGVRVVQCLGDYDVVRVGMGLLGSRVVQVAKVHVVWITVGAVNRQLGAEKKVKCLPKKFKLNLNNAVKVN